MKSTGSCSAPIERLRAGLERCDAVVIGAGAGLSASAGYAYSGGRFEKYFADFIAKYGFTDMYTAGFHRFPALEEQWAFWSRFIYLNRYTPAPEPIYEELLGLVREKDYFVLTTNVDHCFQRAGFDKKRLFYTQGDYGLWQCSRPCHDKTYDNEEAVRQMAEAQGFRVTERGLELPADGKIKMAVPSSLVPRCPVCGRPMSMNLRSDDTFVQDECWYAAAERYEDFLRRHEGLYVLYLELGVGLNTPVIIKYPFWRMTAENPEAAYACVNLGEAFAPREIAERAICIDADIGAVLKRLGRSRNAS